MGIVHGLQRDAGVIAVEVAILHEIFDGIDDLLVNVREVLLIPRLWNSHLLQVGGLL